MILNVNYDLKISKKGGLFARGHVDATWHARPRASATWAHASAYVAQVTRVHIYIYLKYIGYSTYKHSVFGI